MARCAAAHSRSASFVPLSALAAVLVAAGAVQAGTADVTSVQDGSWADGATWDGGSPPTGTSVAAVDHEVAVDAPGAEADQIRIVNSAGGLRVVAGGDLVANTIAVGEQNSGAMAVEGGTCTAGTLQVGDDSYQGTFELGAGVLQLDELFVSSAPGIEDDSEGTFRVAGGGGIATVQGPTYVSETGFLEFRPNANGVAGLSAVSLTDLEFVPGAVIRVEPDYAAQLGDSWDLLDASGVVTGTPVFEFLGPYGMSLDTTTVPGVYRVTVTDVLAGPACPVTSSFDAVTISSLEVDLSTGTPVVGGPTCVTGSAAFEIHYAVNNVSAEPRLFFASSFFFDVSDVAFEVFDTCGGSLVACGGTGAVAEEAFLNFLVPAQGAVILRVSSPAPPPPFLLVVGTSGGWFNDEDPAGTPGINGIPDVTGSGLLLEGETVQVQLTQAPPNTLALRWISVGPTMPFDALGGTVEAFPFVSQVFQVTDGAGEATIQATWPAGAPAGTDIHIQYIIQDLSVPGGLILSEYARAVTPADSFGG